jgi:hypothetical protein
MDCTVQLIVKGIERKKKAKRKKKEKLKASNNN